MSSAIQARDLRRTFGDNHAVDGIDLDVPYGEIYGFLGPNGAGKSTTVKMLCTLLGITSGAASVCGFDVATQTSDIRLRIGVALQDSSIDGKQTGREMLNLQGRLYGLRASDITRRMDDVIGLVDIGSAIDAKSDMLAVHRSQKEWLDRSQGFDSYLHTMRELGRQLGKSTGRCEYAEGWRRHNPLGLCAEDADPLVDLLGDFVVVP